LFRTGGFYRGNLDIAPCKTSSLSSSPKALLPFSLAGVDLELSRDFPVQTALNEHVEQIKRISGADEDEYNDTDDHTAPQGSSPV
jgi:hypothetical protein